MAPSTITSLFTLALLAAASASPLKNLVERADYMGEITWIGPTTGAYSACGAMYAANSMFVAVSPGLLHCSGTQGTPMTIHCNGRTVQAIAIDKCIGCNNNHVDVATAVYEACGYTTTDGGIQHGISWSF